MRQDDGASFATCRSETDVLRNTKSACASVFAAVCAVAFATSVAAGGPITIWIVGSPHTGSVPGLPAATRLQEEARRSGYDLSIQTFAAQGFAAVFADAVTRNTTPASATA